MQFKPGISGNPNGRTPNVPDRRTRFRKLLEPHAEELIGILVEEAKNGNLEALRMCIDRLIPKAKSEPVSITLPDELTNESVLKLGDQILRGISNQEMTIEEGKDFFQIIESHAGMVVATNLLDKYKALAADYGKLKEHRNSSYFSIPVIPTIPPTIK